MFVCFSCNCLIIASLHIHTLIFKRVVIIVRMEKHVALIAYRDINKDKRIVLFKDLLGNMQNISFFSFVYQMFL